MRACVRVLVDVKGNVMHSQSQSQLDGAIINQIPDAAADGVGVGDEDSGFAGISNSVASSHSNSSSASSNEDRHQQFIRSSSAKISDFLLGRYMPIPACSFCNEENV